MIFTFKMIHNYLRIYLKTLEINALKYMNLVLLIFISTCISVTVLFKKTEMELELLADVDILLIADKKKLTRGICHAI